ncbi:hypothetical protein D3C84_888280 [compost metagenome]
MQYLITEKEMSQNFRSQPANTINRIILRVSTFRNIKIFRFQHLIWRCSPNIILLEVMKMMCRPDYFTLPIIMYPRVKSNGPGEMVILVWPGTEI